MSVLLYYYHLHHYRHHHHHHIIVVIIIIVVVVVVIIISVITPVAEFSRHDQGGAMSTGGEDVDSIDKAFCRFRSQDDGDDHHLSSPDSDGGMVVESERQREGERGRGQRERERERT